MDSDAHLAALQQESAAFAAAARLGIDVPVPACPGFTMGDLVLHLGIVHRRAAKAVRTGAPEPTRAERRWFLEPTDPALPDWFDEGAGEVVEVLRAAGPEAPAWHFLPGDGTARLWFRRLAHETAVHRWDAEQAHGHPRPIDGDLAADGVDEMLQQLLPLLWQQGPPEGSAPAGERFHLHRTDGPGEWVVIFEPAGVTVSTEHAKGDLAIRGPASDLVLFVWGRLPADRLELLGDPALAVRWTELAPAV